MQKVQLYAPLALFLFVKLLLFFRGFYYLRRSSFCYLYFSNLAFRPIVDKAGARLRHWYLYITVRTQPHVPVLTGFSVEVKPSGP